ncbi:DNA topoisomerase I [Marinitoga sp. 1135]|uniref:DNA topoisomerase 1 n=1 Tax=Marinitoga piezophila (strain DSM 14283 / JCM 11233 / KA3) TaxID=443254 RepID=H2J7Y2_MARPK|nr:MULTISPECIES: type I DNA topoisomerase [Marinitoga]AEX85473.1 DNA topoisomerase I, bacterial [Marinitoga piezophila KA3]APT75947.1 DNA topoisomerase I [Marinitoga sp. 1137]NUU95687.1 DNA topoisomerase I [Marinitoga sp. 1135]NUU97619.1 DNA topoisomerase I [Marinitoga sp. 1138]
MPKTAKKIVIVESPAKAKTIEKYLGSEYKVVASKGHIRDLPQKKFGVDIEKDFEPEFELMPGKEKVVEDLKKIAKGKTVYLAPDMDREGEAIAWHLSYLLGLDENEENRIIFSEITKNTIQEAIKSPRKIDKNKVGAQLARRILDRIVGYKISPILWRILKDYNTSAGRVQSAALKILVDRERQIFKFKPKEFYKIFLKYMEQDIPLVKIDGKKFKKESISEKKKEEIFKELENAIYSVTAVTEKETKKNPPQPFITSTLQQSAISKYGWSSQKTMQIAQKLYEGIETKEGPIAFITYMRTDSTRISEDAMKKAHEYLESNFGKEYTGHFKVKKSKKKIQDAHEAIRPTDVFMDPKKAKELISGDALKLYTLIWNRFMASQSAPSKYIEKTYTISDNNKKYEFEAVGRKRIFDGFEKFWSSSTTEKEYEIPEKGILENIELKAERDETKPPSRYTEASLVKEMESKGIGRPSTYATIITTLLNRKYVIKEKNSLIPTLVGFVVSDILEMNFPEIVDVKFTAHMEENLDKVESGEMDWKTLLKEFYAEFEKFLNDTDKKLKERSMDFTYNTDISCEKCGEKMQLQFGRYGLYLKCPKCGENKGIQKGALGVTIDKKVYLDESFLKTEKGKEEGIGRQCPKCGGELVIKSGRFGKFIACSNYPECKYTEPLPARGKCPKCGGTVHKMKSKKGKVYYKCSECGEMFWDEPSDYRCPSCNGPLFYKRKNREEMLYCPEEKKYFKESEINEL